MTLAARQYLLPIFPIGGLDYEAAPGSWDEMWDPARGIRPHWSDLVASMARLDARQWSERQQRIHRLLRENGVTYHVYDDPRGYTRTWEVDPVPLVLAAAEWQGIEAGLTQRARLLDLILRDLYGPRRLLRAGLLPPELVYGHTGFLRPLLDALAPDRAQLVFYAADLARGPDGQVWVMADRCQSPSGAGYAIENRSVLARTFPDLLEDGAVARLTPWLEAVQEALNGLAPGARDQPGVLVLTPGPANETYFEHAYLAARLGYTLAQGDDLTVRDGRVWLKAVEGLRRVDVILRRVDEAWCDPLELRADSRLGTPGLVEAVRRGSVAMANPLGSGVLENPALLPFLPAIAKALLGEELRLPMAATWWCGQTRECAHVLANLEHLAIKPIARGQASGTVFGPELDQAQLAAWRARIRAEPHRYVGQQILTPSTVPTLDNGRLVARHANLRSFLVRRGDAWLALPGGLTRCSPGNMLSGQSGALSKDTWVVPVAHPDAHGSTPRAQAEELLTSRSADNLFWAGRYLERAEAVARLLRVVLDGLWDEETTPGLGPLLDALLRLTGNPPDSRDCPEHGDVAACVRWLVTQSDRPGDLAHTVRALLGCAYATREHWSFAIWRLLNRLERDWGASKASQRARRVAASRERTDIWLGRLIDTLAGLAGLASETLARDPAFRFFDLGRRIERGLVVVGIVEQVLGAGLAADPERECLSLVLQSMDSLIAFRRRYRTEPFLAGTLELLLWEADNPRSLIYQLHTGRMHLREIPRQQRESSADAHLARAEDDLRASEPDGPGRDLDPPRSTSLRQTLGEVRGHLFGVSDSVTHTWFTHVQEARALRPLLRTAAR
jgi:uncharacterized circularly permuted ATP-grasp superfamily protein/uncharacterized alpha-E superfamily protein